MASTYLTHTHGSAGTLSTKGTFSCWIKRSAVAGEQVIFTGNDGSNRDFVRFESSSILRTRGCAGAWDLQTTQVFMDVNSWYHIVVSVDTTQSTDSNRVKVYVNGSQITSFGTATYPSPNYALLGWSGNGKLQTLGRDGTNNAGYFDGTLSHVHWIDGTAYDASAFGSVDSVTGEWSINTSPSVTYGTNGFFVLKDGNSVTDQSGNSNNFTVAGGTLTKTESSPSNVFATFNPLLDVNATPTFSNGNNTFVGTGSTNFAGSSIPVSSGKWYVEAKVATVNGSYPIIGVIDSQSTMRRDSTYFVGSDASATNPSGFAVFSNGDIYHNGDNNFSNLTTTYTSGDIIGMALDMDASPNTLGFYKNGALEVTINLDTAPSSAYMFASSVHASASSGKVEMNFGNGYYGTTAVATNSGNGYSGAEGKSIFTYQPPTGYSALSTRGLNQ